MKVNAEIIIQVTYFNDPLVVHSHYHRFREYEYAHPNEIKKNDEFAFSVNNKQLNIKVGEIYTGSPIDGEFACKIYLKKIECDSFQEFEEIIKQIQGFGFKERIS